MRQCDEYGTKLEYDRSCSELNQFINDSRTLEKLGSTCISSIKKFVEAMQDKEKYLANYRRLYTTNCSDSETTSPVESQNSVVKKKLGVSAKIIFHKGLKKIAENTDRTIQQDRDKSLHSLNLTNTSSAAPTRDHIIKKSQFLADRNYDDRNKLKRVQINSNTWWC